MPLGFVSAILPELSLTDVAGVAKSSGYSCVEVMCWPVSKAERRYAGVTHLDVVDFTQAKAVITRTRSHPMKRRRGGMSNTSVA